MKFMGATLSIFETTGVIILDVSLQNCLDFVPELFYSRIRHY